MQASALTYARHRAQQQGMGGLGAATIYNTHNLPPGYTQNSAGQIFDRSGNLFYDPYSVDTRELLTGQGGNTYTQNLFAQLNAATPTLTPAQQAALLAAQQQGNLATAGVSGAGIQIGGLTVSWPMLAIVGVGIYLLQRPGITTRK
ncbi:MAG: hypothetical protein QOF02_3179 [Blastocatellia bacterium]|jgi:hypothetical protein|nr:hypothetical protein [Blastocatellia bacterium]